MKKSFLLASLLAAVLTVSGQEEVKKDEVKTEKTQSTSQTTSAHKSMWVGGKVGFWSENVKDGASHSNFRIGPDWAMMVNESMAFGASFTLANDIQKSNNATNKIEKALSWEIRPYFRWYFAGTERFKFFGDAYVKFGGTKYKTENDVTANQGERSTTDIGGGITPGVQFWFNDSWSIASTIGALEYTTETDNKNGSGAYANSAEETTNNLNLKLDFTQINFSLFYHF